MISLTGDHATANHSATTAPSVPVYVRRVGARLHHPTGCGLALLGADCLAVAATTLFAASCVALVARNHAIAAYPGGWMMPLDLAALFAITIVYLAFKGRYTERIPFWSETSLVVSTSLFAAGAAAGLGLLSERAHADLLDTVALLTFPIFATVANLLTKQGLSRAGLWMLPVVVVGDGPTALEAEIALGSDRSLGYRFVGRADPTALMAEPARMRLRSMLDRHGAVKLLIAMDSDDSLQRQVIECALRERVPFAVVPPPRAFPAFDWDPTRVFSHDAILLSFRDGLSRPMLRFVKAAIDVFVAMMLMVLVSPLFLAIAVAVRLDGGPVFYAHRRVGTAGQPFFCLKFRTMVVDGDRVLHEVLAKDPALAAEWAQTRKLAHDPRITRVGRFLRRTSLDELPQLINVCRLEMSLVGPRPIVESEVPLYGEYIAHYYATRPGMTGLWQVSGRSNTSYARRVQLDVWYVNNWSVWNDVAVLLKTIPVVLGREGAH